MIDGWLLVVASGAAVGSGLMAGTFFVFSTMVMPALRRLPAPSGIAAMQSINQVGAAFGSVFLGTAAACVATGIGAVNRWDEPGSSLLLVGAGLYLVGTLGLTVGYHVPRNEALATVEPGSDDAADRWDRYQAEWTRWNHVRAVAALAATAALVLALRAT